MDKEPPASVFTYPFEAVPKGLKRVEISGKSNVLFDSSY